MPGGHGSGDVRGAGLRGVRRGVTGVTGVGGVAGVTGVGGVRPESRPVARTAGTGGVAVTPAASAHSSLAIDGRISASAFSACAATSFAAEIGAAMPTQASIAASAQRRFGRAESP